MANLIPRKRATTESVMATFRKAVDQLKAVSADFGAEADRKAAESEAALKAAQAAREEASQADDAARRLEAVFGAATVAEA